MKDGIYPKCQSRKVIDRLRLLDSDGHPPFVRRQEPEPEKRPFLWMRKKATSHFQAYVCGECGYTEFNAINFEELNEGRKNGFRSY